jgi:phospho-N-acetylmuramoyl-pentapeptide-transferase
MLYKLSEFSEHFQLFNVFKYITFRTFAALLTSLFIYFIFGKRFIEFLQRLQVGQVIRQEGPQSHLSKKGTPTMGGVLIVGASFLATVLWGNWSDAHIWLCLGILVSFGFIGFIDDYRKMVKKQNLGLQGRHKLVLQFLFAFVAGYYLLGSLGFDRELYVPFVKHIHPNLGWFYLLLIALVVVGASNAVNLTDGLDGLAAAPNIIAFATYAIFAYIAGNVKIAAYLQLPVVSGVGEVAVFCGAVMGALIGFLWYNAYPAEVFMGDVGSLSLGASLGWVAVVTKNEILLIVVGGIFVLETLSVITQVISFRLTGKRIFRMAPLHHHFELKGWAEPKVIVRFWIISFILGILSLATLKLR